MTLSKEFKINPISEREFWIGDNRIYLEDDNIIYIIAVRELNKHHAVEISQTIIKLGDMAEGKVNLLGDLKKAGKPSSEARKVLKDLNKSDKIGKIALLGIQPVARMLAFMVIGSSKNKAIHFFRTKDEALKWLKA